MLELIIKNYSNIKGLYTKRRLKDLAERVINSEWGNDKDFEIGLIFCDDEYIQILNKDYKNKEGPTDVLSFPVPKNFPMQKIVYLGDIVISLETVVRRVKSDLKKAQFEVDLLFVHGLLHLLGYTHQTLTARRIMIKKQAEYLNTNPQNAWIEDGEE